MTWTTASPAICQLCDGEVIPAAYVITIDHTNPDAPRYVEERVAFVCDTHLDIAMGEGYVAEHALIRDAEVLPNRDWERALSCDACDFGEGEHLPWCDALAYIDPMSTNI